MKFLAACFTLLFASISYAGSACPTLYPEKTAPIITQSNITEICYRNFAVMYSKTTRTPLWSAEHITKANIVAAQQISRVNAFHEEKSLADSERAQLADFTKADANKQHYDRGHLAPSADEPDMDSQYESFTLANMVPQHPNLNRNLWEGIEAATRTYVKQKGELYVISGPIFDGAPQKLNNSITIPTRMFKIVYDPKVKKGAAYLVDNKATSEFKRVTIADIEKITSITFFPGMKPGDKAVMLALPDPTPHKESP